MKNTGTFNQNNGRFISFRRRFQAGMNLVELMVAMALGLVVVGGAGQIFLSNTQAFRLQDSVSTLQQSSRLVMEMLLADIRRAGLDMDTAAFSTAGINGKESVTSTASAPGLLQASDEIRVAYVASEAMTDCEGQGAVAGQTIVNLYFVKTDNGLPALWCAGAVNALPDRTKGTSLLRGVESFQLIYGVSLAEGNGYVGPQKYMRAGASPNVWVGAVQVALVVRTETGIQGVSEPAAAIELLDSPTMPSLTPAITQAQLAAVTINGQYPVHRVFTGFAAIRNPARTTFALY